MTTSRTLKPPTRSKGGSRMRSRGIIAVSSLGLSLALASTPAAAQDPQGPNANLSSRVGDLEARVEALEVTPSGGGLLVSDALGQVVGTPVSDGDVISFIDGHWIQVEVDTDGFVANQPYPRFAVFVTTDCSGQPQLLSRDMARSSFSFDGQTLHYAGSPVLTQTFHSSGSLDSFGNITNCSLPSDFTARAGPIVQFDLSTLALVTPFGFSQP